MLDLFAVLGLTPSSTLTQAELRNAYRQALLRHHPDKQEAARQVSVHQGAYSVDEVTLAYTTLSDPTKRAKHLLEVRLQKLGSKLDSNGVIETSTSFEVVDLDDLVYNEEMSEWTRECRCGTVPGFRVSEGDLEREAELGEIMIPCRGCSLWLKVLFQAAMDDA